MCLRAQINYLRSYLSHLACIELGVPFVTKMIFFAALMQTMSGAHTCMSLYVTYIKHPSTLLLGYAASSKKNQDLLSLKDTVLQCEHCAYTAASWFCTPIDTKVQKALPCA